MPQGIPVVLFFPSTMVHRGSIRESCVWYVYMAIMSGIMRLLHKMTSGQSLNLSISVPDISSFLCELRFNFACPGFTITNYITLHLCLFLMISHNLVHLLLVLFGNMVAFTDLIYKYQLLPNTRYKPVCIYLYVYTCCISGAYSVLS